MIRDPIDRVWSQMRMAHKLQSIKAPLEHLSDEKYWSIFMAHSNYPSILERWTALVAPSNFKCIAFDSIVTNPTETMKSVCKFLGIHFDQRFFPQLDQPVYVGDARDMNPQTYDLLRRRLRHIYSEMAAFHELPIDVWRARHFG